MSESTTEAGWALLRRDLDVAIRARQPVARINELYRIALDLDRKALTTTEKALAPDDH